MKKIFTKAMLVAAAAMAFFACQKQEINAPEEVKVEGLNFSAEKPEFADASKTEWTGSEIHWSKGDAIRVAYTCNGVWQDASGNPEQGKYGKLYASDPLSETTDVATFVVPGDFKGSEQGDYKFYGIYPSTLTSSTDLSSAPSVSIDIPSEQTPAANSFYAKADVMVAQSDIYKGIPKNGEKNGSISLKWNRLVAHGHITLKSLPVDGQEVVKSIVLTADAEADMVGKHKVNFNTQEVEKDGSNATNSITINGTNLTIDANGNVTFWACFLPCTWNSISVSVETDKATYTLERNLVELNKTKTFAKNARNVLAINMAEANRAVKNASSLPFVQDFSGMTGTSDITELEGFSSIGGKVYNATGAIRLASGSADGSITTQLLDLSQNFHVKVTASGWDDNELALIVSTSEPSYTETVTLTAFGGGENFAEHIINFQPVSNSASLTFTAKEDVRCYIKKIEILEGHAVAAPVLKATAPNEIAAAGGEGSFNFTLANPQDGQSVSAESNVDWITGESVSGNTVTYTVAVNTSEEPREGTITLSYEGAQSVNVVITQAGKQAEGGEPTIKTWSWAGGGKTAFGNDSNVYKTYGLGSDYANSNAPYLIKLDGTGDYFIVQVDGAIQSVSIDVKMLGGATTSYLDVQGSADGTTFTSVQQHTISGSQNTVLKLATTKSFDSSYRYIKFYFTKGSNVGVGPMSITYMSGNNAGGGTTEPDPEQPGEGGGETPEQPTLTPRNLTFSAATATATVGQAFTAPTLNGEKTGVTYSSSNTAVATVNNSGVVTILAAGTTTITASAPATNEYEAGTASYTLTVNAAQGGGQQTTTTYTFNSKSWGDSTNSWTSGKDGNQLTSGQGVQVTTGVSGANATCKNSFSNVSTVVVKYCTNASKGVGTIKVTIGSVTKTFTVSTSGGTSLRNATFDFNGATGTPKIEVTCTTNSIYVNAISITHTN